MARVEPYPGQRLRISEFEGQVAFEPHGPTFAIPAVIFSDGEPWLGATVYLRKKAFDAHATGSSQKTVAIHATALVSYASFLEHEDLDWRYFPDDRSLRPTYRYRGHVMKRIAVGSLARSTAANQMSVLRAFYSWAAQVGYLDRAAEPFRPRQVAVRYTDSVGLERATVVLSSDLAIRRPRVATRSVEEGCIPLRMRERDGVLAIAAKHFRKEFQLLLKLGFFSGLRLGTILGLTHTALRKHFPSGEIPNWWSISVGPEHGIPTKAGVTYHPSMPRPLLQDLLAYCRSPQRDTRVAKALSKHRDLVFLSKQGKPLTTRSFSHDMTHLRMLANSQGLHLDRFRFHDTRATFGTAFVLAAMKAGYKANQLLPVLMRLMGHSNASSSMSYIDFVEEDGRMEVAAAEWEEFLGLPTSST